MIRRYLYAIVKHPPVAPLGAGLAGEPLSLVAAGDVVAVVGEMEDPPVATPDAIRGHDEVVRRLAEFSDAILPARFGTVQDAPALMEWLAATAEGLGEALRLVAGREQMALHVYAMGGPAMAPHTPPPSAHPGEPGARLDPPPPSAHPGNPGRASKRSAPARAISRSGGVIGGRRSGCPSWSRCVRDSTRWSPPSEWSSARRRR